MLTLDITTIGEHADLEEATGVPPAHRRRPIGADRLGVDGGRARRCGARARIAAPPRRVRRDDRRLPRDAATPHRRPPQEDLPAAAAALSLELRARLPRL